MQLLGGLFADLYLQRILFCMVVEVKTEHTSHSAYVATETESNKAKIDGLLPPNFL